MFQVAHPKVAAGVDEHSSFEEDAVGRFHRTFEIVDDVNFGTVAEAVEASLEVRGLHDTVQGRLPGSVGVYDEGERYSANDPDLLMWVWATLVEQALQGYRTFVGDLTRRERERYYEESKRFAVLMGVPSSRLPGDLDSFYGYYRTSLREDVAVGRQGNRIKEALLEQWTGLSLPMEVLAGGVMPSPVRREYGIPWSAGRRAVFERFAGSTRTLVQRLPPQAWFNSIYLDRLDSLDRSSEDVTQPSFPLPTSSTPW